MAKLSKKQSSKTHRTILFGPPKAGKSLLAGKLAEYFDLIWVDMENGHETLFQLPDEWQDRIELINLPDTRSYPVAIETCLKMVKGSVDICDEHGKVGCMVCKRAAADMVTVDLPNLPKEKIVVFDSLTQLTNSAIANITKSESDDYKLKTDDWGNLAKLMEIFLSHLQQAKYNVVVISHEVEATTEGKKDKLVPVCGSRNTSRNVAKYFDHVLYVECKNRKHIVSSSTTYATTILTGSRTNVALEDAGAEASLLQIYKPELYEDKAGNSTSSIAKEVTTTQNTKSVSESTSDILARLKQKK